jgi:predicted PurR-regulated permease PerM
MRRYPIITVASVVIIVAGMHVIASVLNIFLVALLLAVCILPIISWQLRKGLSRSFSLSVTILIVLILTIIMTTTLGLAFNKMAAKVPFYKERLSALYQSTLQYLTSKGIVVGELNSLELLSPDKLISTGYTFINGIVSTFSNFAFVFLMMVFILIEFADMHVKAERGEYGEDSWQMRFNEIANDLEKYMSITALTGLMSSVGYVILFVVLGIDFAILWGFLSFFFNFIPTIGFILTVIPPALIALLEYGWVYCLIVVVGVTVINSIVEYGIRPRFIGKEFNMPILVVFLSVLFWGVVLGPIGAILGVPMTITANKVIDFTNQDIEKGAAPKPEAPQDEDNTQEP